MFKENYVCMLWFQIADAVNVSGLYICNKSTTCHDCLTMQETMRGQLARISQEQASINKNLKGEKLVAAHSLAVDRVIDEKEELQESVDSLGKELDQSKKQTGKLVHICSEISNAISVIDALKCQMDEIVNDEKQKQECSDSSEPMKLNNAQVSCNLNPVHVSGQRNTNAQSDIHLPDVEEVYKQNKVKKIWIFGTKTPTEINVNKNAWKYYLILMTSYIILII